MAGRRRTEKRKSPFRRQINEAFCDPDGAFSVSKFLAVWTQISVLAHMNRTWDTLIKPDTWATLAIVLCVLIAPDLLKKIITLKLGGVKP